MVSPALSVRSLRKTYKGKRTVEAVKGISFDVAAGECVGLLGPNGAGKSTAINCISGFFPVTTGEVLIEGHNVHTTPKLARARLGVCPQEDTLDTDFAVRAQLIRHAAFFGIGKKEAGIETDRLLEVFQLKDYSASLVEALSGGMRRKLQVARSLIAHPRLVILDEPTTGLDPDARRTLWSAILELRKQQVAVLLSTHYMDEAERLCDRIVLLDSGSILDIDSPPNLVNRHIGDKEVEEEVRPGVIWKRQPNLEDVFLKLTGKALLADRGRV